MHVTFQRAGVRPATRDDKENDPMHEIPAGPVFAVLKILSYVALGAMAASILYAAAMALRYWPGIGV
jgi:hypothetical protein